MSGGTLNASHLTVAWANYGIIDEYPSTGLSLADSVLHDNGTGLYVNDPDLAVNIQNSSILGGTLGIDARAGTISFRGKMVGVGMGIRACNWVSRACSVDAAYVDWGDPAGPFPSGRPALICGTVTVSPWIGGDGTPRPFAVGNCDGSDSPDTQLNQAQSRYNKRIADLQDQCSGDIAEACDLLKDRLACYKMAQDIAYKNVSVGGIPATPPRQRDRP